MRCASTSRRWQVLADDTQPGVICCWHLAEPSYYDNCAFFATPIVVEARFFALGLLIGPPRDRGLRDLRLLVDHEIDRD